MVLGGYSSLAQSAKANDRLQFYLTDLRSATAQIHYHNYEEVVYQKVCPYMENLHSMERAQKINPSLRQKILNEVVRIYDKAFDFSGEHYLMYCIYNYYKSTNKANEIFQITQRFLSPKKQKKFKRMWKICDQEEREGNGDSHPTVSAKKSLNKHSYLLPKEDYKNLTLAFRLNYIKKIKRAFLKFEVDTRKSALEHKTASLLNFFIARSLASSQGQCLIGGKMRSLVYSQRLRRTVCPVYGNSCDGSKNNFQCGPVFSSKCIPINPVRSISERCYKSSQNEPLPLKNYEKYKSDFDNTIKQYCRGKRAKRVGCIYVTNRIKQINRLMVKTPSSSVKQPSSFFKDKKPQANTEAQAVCTENCEKKNSDIADIDKALKSARDQEDIVQFFSDTVFDNAKCTCDGNNACKRGCQTKVARNQSPPVVKCKGPRRDPSESTGKCMRYVTGAIMSVVRQKLAIYCNENSQNTKKDYNQCMQDFRFPSPKNNICRNGFVFPSGLCALNLDGKSAGDFQNIKDSEVREECEMWDQLNQSLVTFPVKQANGDVKQVPLFKKMDLKKNQEFQKDPSKIPEGAIVVMKSKSRHGHAEIKTSKNNCGLRKIKLVFVVIFA